ncbi:TonB-dependent receptor [Olivibacter ginsenosidimutans]|uniref:TonB-dependent receptor n=1 Tax=Olivibacter ginsenosidimutans TaxID=1176537 RepID=A0ABP9BU94_9SPHI
MYTNHTTFLSRSVSAYLLKMLFVVKCTLVLLVLTIFQGHATSYAQKITLKAKHASLKHVLYQISKQTGYNVISDGTVQAKIPSISLDVKDMPLKEVLTMYINQNDAFDIVYADKTILIREKQKAIAPQDVPVRGVVRDETGEPMVGVSISVQANPGLGTRTDNEGRFSLNIPPQAVLIVSYLGYQKQEVAYNGQASLTITMKPDEAALDEVVVVGYGTVKRQDFTGSVGSLKLEDSPIAMSPNVNVLESLKGNIAGLNIGASNTAGGEPAMQIRGQNSISGTNTPLIVLDGVIFMGSLSDINPNDIASIDVLKDATSAAAYGSRSANGVIAVTTKKGRTGKPMISFNASSGFQNWQNKPVMLKGEDWINMVNARNQYTEGTTTWMKSGELANREAGKETVWLDEVSRTGVMQNYQAAISGATENINYYLSSSYDNNKGVVVGDQFDRMSILGKLNANITSWLEVGVDAGFSRRDYSGVAANIIEAQTMSPYGVMYRDDQGNLEKYPYTQSGVNPLWGVNDGTRDNEDLLHNYRLNSHATIKVPWVDGLSYRINYLLNQDQTYYGNFYYESYYIQEGESPDRYSPATVQGFLTNANGSMDNRKTYSYVVDNIINYNKLFGKHSLDVTAVATRDYTRYQRVNAIGRDFAANGNTTLGINGLHKATVQQIDLSGDPQPYVRTNIGYLGRVNYSFDNKYFFTGSYRRDGASVFGDDNKWANFWAAGLAWRVTNEPFMQSFTLLNDLKLKFSWGQNGNQGVEPYGTLSTVANAASGGARYEFSNDPGKIYYGLFQNTLGNSLLGWETTSSWNTGFESAWLDNRISLNFDAYFAKTTDQIFTRNIPVMTGFKQMKTSMGQVNNTGLEATLSTVNVQKDDLHWTTSLTFWKNFNKLVSLYGDDLDGDGWEDDDIANSLFIGHALGAIYGYRQIGIVQPEDTEYMELTGAVAGAPKYQDLDGVPGITAADREILGYRKENFKLNFSSNLNYKNFGLYVMVTGTFGGNNSFLKDNATAYLVNGTGRFNDNLPYIPYWTPENRSNEYPSATFAGDGRFLGLQSRGFVRIQDVTLSYTFNQPWLKNAHINALKVFATAKNLATFTNWVGGDPEVGARLRESDTSAGARMPVASTYSLGVNMSF